ncbi:MAG: phosphate transport system regulatory protein PhoU [Candidatus Omnitrophica bacterium CG1_02_49_16]|nr:MAG: phosphate transport system regulatory protein PhoU [Candidatus Omnitrophica bacterium CG1_02_49_16]
MIERHFDEELIRLKQKLLEMGDMTQEMIEFSIKALVDRKEKLINQVLQMEEKINRMEVEIEKETIRLLATRQPTARDLRLLTGILKMNNDLERIADQAVNIAEIDVYLLKEPLLKHLIDIPHMAVLARRMVRDSLKAFIHHDHELAKQVCLDDDKVDRLNDQVFRELLTYVIEDPKKITRAVDLILVARNLERIADHATNISKNVVFIEEGKNIKHHLEEEALVG